MSVSVTSTSSCSRCTELTEEAHEKDNPSFGRNEIDQDDHIFIPPPRSHHSCHEYSHNFHVHKGDDIFLMLLENRRAHWNIGKSTPPPHFLDIEARHDHDEVNQLASTLDHCNARSSCSVISDDVSSISSDDGHRASEGNKIIFIKKNISRDGNSHSSGGSGNIVIHRSGRFGALDNDLNLPFGLTPCVEGETPPDTPPRKNSKDSVERVSPNTTTPPTRERKRFSLKKMVPKFLRRRGSSFHFPSEPVSVTSNGTGTPTDPAVSITAGINQQVDFPSRPRFLRRLTL